MTEPALDMLVLTDLHYAGGAACACVPQGSRNRALAPALLDKALHRLRSNGVEPDLLILLGDLLDDGNRPGAGPDLDVLAAAARETGLPWLAVPGNHDGNPQGFFAHVDTHPGLHVIKGCGFLLFADPEDAGHRASREALRIGFPESVAASHPGMPLIALQHNPLHPPIDAAYPYLLTNAAAVMDGYTRAGVILSLSGHYHPGQPASSAGGTAYCTVPAICEAPYRFCHVRLRGRRVQIAEHALYAETPGLIDAHCHTEFAYCGKDVRAETNVALARALGLEGLCLTEHAFQIYFEREAAWSFAWQSDPGLAERAFECAPGRMAAYRACVMPLRDRFAHAGLEVDALSDGRLLLAPADLRGWDVLLGAVHRVAGRNEEELPKREAETRFMQAVEHLTGGGIDVLAHPFRFFKRRAAAPSHLYEPVAERLAAQGVAAEVNTRNNRPDPAFLEICLSRGVKLALGSDSHALAEVGDLQTHLALLRETGVREADLPRILWRPSRAVSA